jgi:hypothetical protein
MHALLSLLLSVSIKDLKHKTQNHNFPLSCILSYDVHELNECKGDHVCLSVRSHVATEEPPGRGLMKFHRSIKGP